MPRPVQRRHNFLKEQEQQSSLAAETPQRAPLPPPVPRAMTHVQYGPVAVVASRREQVVVIFLAVRLSLPLKEVPGAYLLLTVCTHKVLGVPRTAHGGHHLREQERRWRWRSEPKMLTPDRTSSRLFLTTNVDDTS